MHLNSNWKSPVELGQEVEETGDHVAFLLRPCGDQGDPSRRGRELSPKALLGTDSWGYTQILVGRKNTALKSRVSAGWVQSQAEGSTMPTVWLVWC